METVTPTSHAAWSTRLRDAGLRVTAGRVATLNYIEMHPHSSVSEIHTTVSREHASLSVQSVHNITTDLTEHGIIRRIDPPDSTSALFETRVADNHHHIQCVQCQRIEDLDCVIGQAPCLTPSHNHGMRLLEASVTFRGICANCDLPTATTQTSSEASTQ